MQYVAGNMLYTNQVCSNNINKKVNFTFPMTKTVKTKRHFDASTK